MAPRVWAPGTGRFHSGAGLPSDEVVPGLVGLEVAVPRLTFREVGVGRFAKNIPFRQGAAVKKYQKTDVNVPGALELTVPEQVNVVR